MALPGVDYNKCHLGSSRLEYNVSAAAYHAIVVPAFRECNDCDMISEINVYKEGTLCI